MAGNNFGGEMRLRGSSGTAYTLRSAVTMNTASLSTEAVRNQNGKNSYVATLRAPSAELTLEDEGQDMEDILRAGSQDIYIIEEFTGVTHVYVFGRITGEPQSNRENGELSGLMIQSDEYRRVRT
ncbi:hypothetical protein [Aurantimonas sp. 22II-16-19i]|uniref:hypothetical protein n=1 Tax=Aurantimonas sp. 22II-16-19i TaxID=1317114 RepID=UPI0009F7E10B|nr:hypothetical protein [Aurantimonas sp. 22II-16-19i]ORE91000.1 hypothetical protein ATO4_20099 [Aurantimonas sp. 22II-16-19i]